MKDWDGNPKRDTAIRCTEHHLGARDISLGAFAVVNPANPLPRCAVFS